MSISQHIDLWFEENDVEPDDTVVVDNPCAIFDGSTELDPAQLPEQADSERRRGVDDAAERVRDLLG